jgi:hypothetical protein
MTTVSAAAAGLAVPFVVGNPLPAPSAGNAEFFVIVAGAIGAYGPTTVPASTPPYHLGDWFLSDGTNWEFLNVGFQYQAATTTVEGVVYLATDLEVQTGTDTSNKAVNPASLQAKVSDSTSTTSSTTIASSTAVKAAYDAGVAAQATADAALPKAGGTMTGTLNTLNVCLGTGNNISFNGGASGTIRGISDATGATNDDIAASSTAVKNAYTLADAAVPKSCYTALGALAAGTGASTVGTLALGTNGQILVVNSACGAGLEWCTLSLASVPCSAYTAVGTILAGNGAGTYCSLAVGTNGQVLVPNSACAAGVEWVTRSALSVCGYTCTLTPFNTALGANAGDSVTTGTCNTVVGYNAGTAISGGLNNTFIGFSAGDGITTSDNNTAVGSNALGNTGGNNNTAVGFCSGGGISSGGNNTMIGVCAGRNATTADNTTVLGFNALSGPHTGNGTVALGACALAVSTIGGCNTAVGCNAGLATTSGALNTLVGFSAGSAITTGGSNTLVGRYVGTSTLANNVVLSDGAGTIRFQSNASGAISLGAGGAYGTAGQVLVSQGSSAAPTWVNNTPDGVAGVTGTAPITVDNTDPANPIIDIDAASTTAAGAVQLNDTTSSTSTTLAATANSVKTAYDAAIAAQGASPLTSATVLYVNVTTGNNSTAARGTAKPFATITAALAAASEGDTIFVAPGDYTDDVTLNKGVSIIGSYVDQAIATGPRVRGAFTVSITGVGTRNWAVSNLSFISAVAGGNTVTVSNNSFASGGLGSFTNCLFMQSTVTSVTETCFITSGTWTRSLYLRNCSFDGNAEFSAGTVTGTGAYTVIDRFLGIATGDNAFKITAGTVEFRDPSQVIPPILQTGGTFLGTNISAWASNTSVNTSIFGGTGFAYKGTASALGSGSIFLAGQGSAVVNGTTWGKLSVGTNVIYAFGNVAYDTSLATLNGFPLTVIAPNPNGVLSNMARPQWNYLVTPSSVTAANQLGVILDSTNGNVYTTSSFDAGTF